MPKKEEIIQLIFDTIDIINENIDEKLEKSPETSLFGSKGELDSFGLVNLITAVEEAIDEKFDAIITLADEKAMSQRNSPFRTVNSLADYIHFLLNDDQ